MSEISFVVYFLLLLLLFFFCQHTFENKNRKFRVKIVGTYSIFLEKIKITFEVFEKLFAQVQNVK